MTGNDITRMCRQATEHSDWAEQSIIEILENWPKKLVRVMTAAQESIESSDWQRASTWLAQAQALISSNLPDFNEWRAEICLLRGQCFAQLGNKESALSEFDQARGLATGIERLEQAIARAESFLK